MHRGILVMKIIISVLSAASILGLIVVAILVFFPYNGGPSITLPGWFSITADPPRKELLSYMNEKYGVEFHELTDEDFKGQPRHFEVRRWQDSFNGIVVYTDSFPGHYFYVRKKIWDIRDDYSCHLVQQEAEEIIHEQLEDIMTNEFKIYCHPYCNQDNECPADLTADEYLSIGSYEFIIFICGDGEEKEQDYEKIKPRLIDILENRKIRQYSVTICYFDPEYFNDINTTDTSTCISHFDDYNAFGSGSIAGVSREESGSTFRWIENKDDI